MRANCVTIQLQYCYSLLHTVCNQVVSRLGLFLVFTSAKVISRQTNKVGQSQVIVSFKSM